MLDGVYVMFHAIARPPAGRAVLLLSLLCVGCSEPGPRIVRVSGTVTRQGSPVDKLVIHFVPEEGRESWGAADEKGHYTLRHDRRPGAVTGKHKVWVEVRPKTPKEEEELAAGTLKLHPQIDQIVEKYGDRQNPALTVEVKNKDPQVIDLKLD